MDFTFHTTLDAADNIVKVHYKRMKCDVLFSQGIVNEMDVFFMYVLTFFLHA